MKKNQILTSCFAILCLFLVSCDSDDDFNPVDPGPDPINFEYLAGSNQQLYCYRKRCKY